MPEPRMDYLERRLLDVASRLDLLEGEIGRRRPSPTPAVAPSPVAEPTPAPAATPRLLSGGSGTSFEEVFGGRVLAWIGGSAILLGVVLFLGMAISHGWIDEPTRTAIAFLGATALLVAGVWLHER